MLEFGDSEKNQCVKDWWTYSLFNYVSNEQIGKDYEDVKQGISIEFDSTELYFKF